MDLNLNSSIADDIFKVSPTSIIISEEEEGGGGGGGEFYALKMLWTKMLRKNYGNVLVF